MADKTAGLAELGPQFDETSSRIVRELLEQISKRNERLTWLKAEQKRLTAQLTEALELILQQQQELAEKETVVASLTNQQDILNRQMESQIDHYKQGTDALQQALAEKEEYANRLSIEREGLARDVTELQAAVQSQQQALAEKEEDANRLSVERDGLVRDVTELQAVVRSQQQSMAQVKEDLSLLTIERRRLTQEIGHVQATAENQREELESIYSSLAWRMVCGYRSIKDRLLSHGTRRRQFYDRILLMLKSPPITRKENSARKSQFVGTRFVSIIRCLPAIFTRRNFGKVIKHSRTFGLVGTYQKVKEKLTPGGGAFQSTGSISASPVARKVEVTIDGDIPKEEVTISVVIPTKNAGESFRRILAMIANQRGFRDVEIVVVDSGSVDRTVELAEQFGAKIIKILPEEFSHSYARNLGAGHASGDYLLFTVQDALPPSDSWLRELFSVINSNGVVAVSCAEFPWENADLFYRAISWNHYRFLEVDWQDRIMSQMGARDHLSLRKNGQLSDLACLISRDIFAKYGYQTDYGEDLDLGLRLIKDGHRIAFSGSTRIIHSHDRPAYYYLKRGCVENLFIPRIFPDYPVFGSDLERLIPEMGVTNQVVKSMVDGGAQGLPLPCKTAEFASRVIDKFQAALKAAYPVGAQVADSHFLDTEFQDFLNRVIKENGSNRSAMRPSDGDLGEAVLNFTRMILTYMDEAYELVDERVIEEFRSSLYKTFAYQCGAQLAQCYLRSGGMGDAKLERIRAELTKGV